ncbi:MAG TPA: transposase [Terrimesophilobacter sp.]|nr:transposase [Terrimesophilobacter sp.]
MPRRSRDDHPDAWHHVFNRAIARRTMFERREDFRYFLACLARAARRGDIEVHAYCLMGTHYHLLLRSPSGRLAEAMHGVQLAYSRWFNRSRRRDGSLVRSRYGSKPVRSHRYRQVLLRYIDLNPVHAKLVDRPSEYPWGSAARHGTDNAPLWLTRDWVDAQPDLEATPDEVRRFVESRMNHPGVDDPWDDIVDAANPSTRTWMVRKALLADGTRPGLPLLPLPRLERILEERNDGPWVVQRGCANLDGWRLAHIGLGRDLCGETMVQLADHHGTSATTIRRMYAYHRAEMDEQTPYSAAVEDLARYGLDTWR